MGILTESITQLRDEIVSSRHARMVLRGDLVHQTNELRTRVSALCAGFARDRAGAHSAWFGSTLSERQTAERQQQHRLAIEARATPPPAKAEPQRHKAARPVPSPAARPPVARLPQAPRASFKRSKKH